ncbi:MAG TPA: hypothetical protein VGX68_04380 [Thermoanaerobaculia bacterium]|nr:hypothetical protein [Thermoanaerobaculia bacterium]
MEPAEEGKPYELKVTFHGYLTQAYAQSDGHQFLGISEDGTADYRTAALQVRADISRDDAFVVQFSHERFGDSRIEEIKDDVELDWIFYERRFGDSAVKVGRVQIPFGIYNEVRDVGTLLPFYRPSHNFYGEAAFSSETVDGIVLSHSFSLGKSWGLEADAHYGNWEFTTKNFVNGTYAVRDVDDSIGAELWLETPVSGLRIGAGAMRYNLQQPTGEAKWKVWHASLAGDFDRFAFHTEYKNVDIGTGTAEAGYAHLGVNVTPKLTLNAQQELLYLETRTTRRTKLDDETIAGVNYTFHPGLVLKTEHHWSEGSFWLEDVPAFGVAGTKTRYWLVSLSTSF